MRNVVELDGLDGWWRATSPTCAFRLVPGTVGLPTGWARITIRIKAPRGGAKSLRLEADCGHGYQQLRILMPRRSAAGRWTMLAHLPDDAIAIAVCPSIAPGPFHLGAIEVARTTRLAVGARLTLRLSQIWLREPARFTAAARAIAAGWRRGRMGGVRAALGRALLGEAPAEAGVAGEDCGPTEHYRRWIVEQESSGPPIAPAMPSVRFSVLIPVQGGGTERLRSTLLSLQLQTGAHWECLVGLAPDIDANEVAAATERLAGAPVTQLIMADGERGGMLAELAVAATGDLLMVLEPGDCLGTHALAALAAVRDADITYGDEDRIDADGRRNAPSLKPEWSPELLHAYNYFGRPTALRRSLVEQAGGFMPGLGAGAEWDLHLRLTAAGASVRRATGILCRRHHANAADRPDADRSAAAQLRSVIAAHWQRQGITATVTTQPDGTQRSVWPIRDAPLVSIIIVNRDQQALLQTRLRRITSATRYPHVQIIIVNGASTDPATLALHAREQEERSIEVVSSLEPYNTSAACNEGARAARGELLLFLNSDIEATSEDWLEELVRFAQRPGIGVVGPMLVDTDGTLLHAGMTFGKKLRSLPFRGALESEWGPFGSPLVPRTVLAVTGACQMVRREVFARVGGFDETFATANGNVALCLAGHAAGWRTAYTPFAKLVQHVADHQDPVEVRTRLVSDIRRFGFDQDPYFHPALDTGSDIPRLRIGTEANNAASPAEEFQRGGAEWEITGPLDLCDDSDVAFAIGIPLSELRWQPPLPDAINDQITAARWCIDLLRRRSDLRARFPNALSSGASGDFALWLASREAQCLGLSAAASEQIQAVLAGGVSVRARQAVLTECGLSGAMALVFMPQGRAALLRFLVRREGPPLPPEAIWWLALECSEDPARELVLSYRFNTDWQAMFPDGLTVFGQPRFAAWLRATYRCEEAWTEPNRWPHGLTAAQQIRLAWNARAHWQRHHPQPFSSEEAALALLAWLAEPAAAVPKAARDWLAVQPVAPLAAALLAPGVTIIGHFGYPSGLRTSALAIVQGLRAVAHEVSMRNVPVDAEHDLPNHADYCGLGDHDATLLHIQPEPFFLKAYDRSALHPRRPRSYRIGYWYWELETVPESWSRAVAETDELWVATRFVGDALRSRFDIDVHNLMPGVELPEFTRRSLAQFGLPKGCFIFLFVFHMMSIMERKNPLGLIRAFRLAFTASDPVTLVLKTSFGEKHPDLIGQLHAMANEPGGKVIIIDRVFTNDETISLMDACDVYVSLHRSEGLGLSMAEAMLLGKPVIATGYSGNLDFMNDSNSLLAEHRMVTIDAPTPPYPVGSVWAEPSEPHAARLMRRVWENPAFAAALGDRAKRDLTTSLSMAAAGRRMADRLAAIRRQRIVNAINA